MDIILKTLLGILLMLCCIIFIIISTALAAGLYSQFIRPLLSY